MLLITSILKFIFPYVITIMSCYFYKKFSKRMCKFYWLMTQTKNGPKLYTIILIAMMLLFNWCCYYTHLDKGTVLGCLILIPFISFRLSDKILHVLHENNRVFYFTLFFAVLFCSATDMYPLGVMLLMIAAASYFYPSTKVLLLTADVTHRPYEAEEYFMLRKYYTVLENYY